MGFIYRFSLAFSLAAAIAVTAMESMAAPSDEDRRWNPAVKESDAYEVDYDEQSRMYTFYNKGYSKQGTPAKVMSSDEYRRYQFDNAVREAWNTRRDAEMGSGSRSGGGGGASKLIPDIKINSALVSSLLGSDLIKFNIQGAVEAIFGYNWTRTDNPTVPEQYRSHGAFDFKVNMQINASGSIGDRININFVNSTDVTFDFQNLLKINYQGDEDQIIQKIEAGNVSLPLSGSLITGSQSLFGVKTELKFGHLTIESIISEQKGQSSTINVKGGAQTTLFDIAADKYDANRHFFLAHYFRNRYNDALKYLPLIQSGIHITRLEVWVTNRNNRFESSRNIIALDALGSGTVAPSNDNNILYQNIKNRDNARNMSTANKVLEDEMRLTQVQDFEKVENARRLTPENDYRFNAQLGYISLTYPLNADEVLGVAFEYTMGGRSYRVGEFYDDGVAAPKALFVKMLKGTNLSPRFNTWSLMMKNVYSLETYQLSSDNFVLNVMYHDDAVGTNVPYITEGNIKNLPLLQALNLDNLNNAGNRYPDGRFDYVDGVTVLSNGGRIIFPVLEPFGRDLGAKIGYPTADKYTYNELYDSTLVKAKQFADKNKFRLTGSYKSTSASEIMLNATDIPEGSVVVTAGGIKLIENVDYTVNYTLGRVQIINPVYLGSNVPLQVSMESMDMFSFVKKTLLGTNLKYQFSKDFKLGATILHLSERPLTQKVTYGDEPIANTIWGLNGSYSREVNLLTKMVDAIPLIETKAPSRITLDGEFAQLLPGHSSSIGKSGTTYIDDFEASKMSVDLKQYTSWALGSTPEEVTAAGGWHFAGGKATTMSDKPLSNGYSRSLLAWYVIDPLFLRNLSTTPTYMRNNPKQFCKNHYVREIDEKEIFPKKDVVIGVDAKISVLNVAYYPNERGPYNYIDFGSSGQFPGKGLNPNGSLKTPRTNFGAMMRSLSVTDFETNNIEYIEFWMLDPFIYTRTSADRGKFANGRLYFNLGDVSEDVLKDTRKSFENGLPYPYDTTLIEETDWGYVPRVQSLVNTFDNNEAARAIQDVGYDGMTRAQARVFFDRKHQYLSHIQGVLSADAMKIFEDDPSNDLYHYYRGSDYDAQQLDILSRYKRYNNLEGNSPVASGGLSTSATTMPNTEDINMDNTLNELESYYEYYIDLTPDAIRPEKVGQNYIADVRTVSVNDPDYGDHQTAHWYQFKIPIADGKAINNIEDFKSIRFMRMFFTGFDTTVICRFAKLDLVRGEWRKYSYSLLEAQEGLAQPETGTGTLDISAVSIEENSDRSPVNYLLPPGISRIVDNTTNQPVQRNEQAMMLTINNLADGDARAAYKNATFDMRQFRRLIMDVHAEAINESRLKDNDLSLFVRIGSDYRYNYYEYEIPLKLTPHGRYSDDNQRELVWPVKNKLDIPLSIFTDLKLERNSRMRTSSGMTLTAVYEKADGENTVRVVGNPNLGEVYTLMIGVKNPVHKGLLSEDDGLPKDGIIWVNEMRFTNFNEEGGWAANMRIAANFADFANVSLAGSMSKAGFGSLDSRILTRSQEDTYQYDIATNFELGKFFPVTWGVTLPLSFAFAENFIVPLYNPFDPDIKLQDALNRADPDERERLQNTAIDYTMRRNLSLNNVRVVGSGKKLLGPADISNFTVGYAFSEELMHDVNTERDYQKEQRVMGAYAYSVKPYVFEPFAKNATMKSASWKIIRDFNLALYPNQYGFTTDLTDAYTEYIARSFYEGMQITPIVFHEQINNRSYTLGWDIARAIKFTFSANNLSRREISTNNEVDTIFADHSWRNTRYNHDFSIAYTLPINKLPIFTWTNITASYKATYAWEAPQVISSGTEMPYVGNTVRNSNNFQLNGAFNFVTLYNKSALLKGINQEMDGRSAKKKETKEVTFEQSRVNLIGGSRRTVKHNLKNATGIKVQVFDEAGKTVKVDMETVDNRTITIRSATGQKNLRVVVTGKAPVVDNVAVYIGKLSARTLMSLRNVNIVYARGGETMLPGYTPKTTLMGLDDSYRFNAPGWDFVAGSQSKDFWGNFYGTSTEYMLTRAYQNSWIIGDSTFINPFTMNAVTSLSMQATIEPFRDVRIDITAKQGYSNNKTWYDINNNGSRTPTEMGSFTISTISIFSAFETPKSETYYNSKAYQRFSQSRMLVADELARQKYGAASFPRVDSTGGYPDGFSGLSQDVLIPSFEAGYLNKSINSKTIRYTDFLSKIPLPNWTLTYSGLSRIAALKPFIKSATLSHSYASTYGINAFATNTNYVEKPGERDAQNDFYSPYSIAAVSLDERIVLGSLDVAWQNGIQTRVELRKNRRVDLSMTNNQIIENNAWEGAAGAGYTLSKIPQLIVLSDQQSATTTLTLRADFTYRDGKNLIRKLAEDTHQITDGRRNMAIKFTSDYVLMKDLTFRLFFDWTENSPYVSAVNTENISFGFSLRYVMGM